MNVMVAGFDADATRRLSQELRGAGHHVLGAEGRHGTRTFLHAKVPDVVVVPAESSARVREWTADLGLTLAFVEVPMAARSGHALAALKRFTSDPEPDPEPEPEPEPDPPVSASVIVEANAEPIFEILGHRFPAQPTTSFDDDDAARDWDPDAEPVDAPPPLPELRGEARLARPRRRGRIEVETPASAPAPEARDTGRSPRPTSPAADPHPDLVAKLAQVRFADYFQILEVEPSGSPFQAREAHERLARRYSPRGWSGRLMPEEIDMLDEIARGIADAALVLTDPELRVRYERGLGGGSPQRSRT